MRQLALSLAPPRSEGFDTVVPGPNEAVLEHLQALLDPGLPAPEPVYLWGPPGSGKTRLLRAVAHELQAAGDQAAWFDATTPLPWQHEPRWGALLLDDVDRFDAGRQHAAFALFIESAMHGQRWIATGAAPPVDLPVREDLGTRLGWGPVFALKPLADDDLRAVLRFECDARDLRMADDVIEHLLTHHPRDLAHLMRLLERLDAFALSQHRLVTVPLLRSMMQAEAAGRPGPVAAVGEAPPDGPGATPTPAQPQPAEGGVHAR